MLTEKHGKYAAIFLEYYDSIMKIIGRRVQNNYLAQDICQETFMRLYANMDKINEETVKGWLIVTAKNIVIDLARKSKPIEYINIYDEKGEEAFGQNFVSKSSIESEYNEKLRREFRQKILKDLKQVNKEWHRIIVSFIILDKSQDEIANSMGISIEALRAKLYRARKWIKKEYNMEYQDLKEICKI